MLLLSESIIPSPNYPGAFLEELPGKFKVRFYFICPKNARIDV
jgi:hypothetical protein